MIKNLLLAEEDLLLPEEALLVTQDYWALLSLILIHRKAPETLFLVTRLAQWAGPRTGPGVGSGGYRVRFRVRPRPFSDIFRTFFGHVWE